MARRSPSRRLTSTCRSVSRRAGYLESSSRATVTVSDATLASLELSLAAIVLPAGTTQRLVVIGIFSDGSTRDVTSLAAVDELRDLITFNQLNLFAPRPMRGPFDVILCPNVIIYFDVPNKTQLVRGFHDKLATGGQLLLGHSESLPMGISGL